MSLLNTRTGFTAPWHCSVALMADGERLSAPMGDFKDDPMLEILYEDGRPSHFQQKASELCGPNDNEKTTTKQQLPRAISGQSNGGLLITAATTESPPDTAV